MVFLGQPAGTSTQNVTSPSTSVTTASAETAGDKGRYKRENNSQSDQQLGKAETVVTASSHLQRPLTNLSRLCEAHEILYSRPDNLILLRLQ